MTGRARILFTGASSFTGYWFVRELAARGHEVTATFRLEVEGYEGVREKRVLGLLDLCDAVHGPAFGDDEFLRLAGEGRFDLLCHHAADVTDYKNPAFDVCAALANNTRSIRPVLEAIRAGGGRAVLLTGSFFEGGGGVGSGEDRASSPYGLSKELTGRTFEYYSAEAGLPLRRFVIPNPFGPFEEPRFTSYLARTWLSGGEPSVNTPDYVRDNIHVGLLAAAYARYVEGILAGAAPPRLRPSGYVETQGAFTLRFARRLEPLLGVPCPVTLREQTEWTEPRIRINTDAADAASLGFDEERAWADLAAFYLSEFPRESGEPLKILVAIVCYRAPDLTIDCLRSLVPEVRDNPDVKVMVCENGTGGDSVEQIAAVIEGEGMADWATLVDIHPNRGFAGGTNVLLDAAMSWEEKPEYFLPLNADTIVRPGALGELLRAIEARPDVGIIGPRLEWPDGTPQISCFRDRSPVSEFLIAARSAPLTRALRGFDVPMPVSEKPVLVPWLSLACALVRREVVEKLGPLDDGYYLYFDDLDYCRMARRVGFKTLYWPAAHVVHLRGRSNPVKEMTRQLKPRPRYYYASRSRYFAKHYGVLGLWATNLGWTLGRSVSLAREVLGRKERHLCEREWRDIWTNWLDPMQLPPTAVRRRR